MHFSTLALALACAAVASAANITVLVGDTGLEFNPTNVAAAVGDTVRFEFRSKNHTVTQSTFADPCTLMTTPKQGIDSGFQPVAAGATQFPSWSFTIDNATSPLWFFCRQTGHCQSGMVFAINPNANKTFAAFQAAAKASSGSSSSSATGSASGAYPTATTPTSSGAAASPSSSHSGALRTSGNAAVVLAIVGLVAGLAL
jgi:plastocyanin